MCRKSKKIENVKPNANEGNGEVMASPKASYMSLAPKADLGDSEYVEALKFALQDSSVHNIAIAGKYKLPSYTFHLA